MNSVNLTDNFLIAMPALEDPYFSNALVYICEHNENGALGIIVNRPIDMNLAGLFEKIDIKLEAESLANLPVYFGGPVQLDRGFVLHRPMGQWQSTLAVNSEVGLTSSRDVLASVGKRRAARRNHRHARLRRLGCRAARERIGPEFLADRAGQAQHPVRPAAGRTPAGGHAEARHQLHASSPTSPGMPDGTVLAFDFGEKRIGVATGETLLGSAHPLTVIHAESNDDRFAAIGKLIAEWQPVQLVVGLPTHADGTPHEMTRLAHEVRRAPAAPLHLPVGFADERLTSLDAEARLRETGRNSKTAKPLLDAVAAQLILQTWFESPHHATPA